MLSWGFCWSVPAGSLPATKGAGLRGAGSRAAGRRRGGLADRHVDVGGRCPQRGGRCSRSHAATSSRLLYDVLGAIYDWVGFDCVGDAVFRDLVIARIVEPTSKVDSLRVLADLGAEAMSYRTIQRHLGKSSPAKYRDVIAARCFEHAANRGGLSLLLYDVTTLYFEAENEDALRKVGYSKERRVDPQIVVGLLVDRTGFPTGNRLL